MEHEVFEHKLDGGAKGLVIHVPGSQVVNLVITFNSGFQFGDSAYYELPHVMEHLLAGGAKKRFPAHSALSIELQKNGAFHNAYTSATHNSYEVETAHFDFNRILGLLHDYFLEPLFPEDELQTEINNVRQELTRNVTEHASTVSVLAFSAGFPQLYMTDAQRLKQLPQITRQATIDYYHHTHTWKNMRFYLAGDFPDCGTAAVARLAEQLQALPGGQRLEPDLTPGRAFAPIVEKRSIEQVYYHVNWFNEEVPLELESAASIFNSLITQGFGSRIYGSARHAGLAYELSGGIATGPGSSRLSFAGPVTLENLIPLFELIAREITAILEGKVSSQELTEAKDLRVGSRIRATQTDGQLLNWYRYLYEDRDEIVDWDGWNEQLRAVTREQVIEVARLVTAGANFGSAFVGPVTKTQAERFAKVLEPVSRPV